MVARRFFVVASAAGFSLLACEPIVCADFGPKKVTSNTDSSVESGSSGSAGRNDAGASGSGDAAGEGGGGSGGLDASVDASDAAGSGGAPIVEAGVDATDSGGDADAGPIVQGWPIHLGGVGLDFVTAIEIDSDRVYLGGGFAETVDFGIGPPRSAAAGDGLLARYDLSGSPVWVRTFGGTQNDDGLGDSVVDLTVDAAGDLYAAGRFYGPVADFGGGFEPVLGGLDAFIASYAANGDHRWSSAVQRSVLDDESFSIAMGPAGEVLVGGKTETISRLDSKMFFRSVAADGSDLGVVGGPGTPLQGGPLVINGVATESSLRCAAGCFNAPQDFGGLPIVPVDLDMFVACYDATGAAVWAAAATSVSAGDCITDLAPAPGSLHAVGTSSPVFGQPLDTFVLGEIQSAGRVGTTPTLLDSSSYGWLKQFATNLTDGVVPRLATDTSGNVYATTIFRNTVTVDGRPFMSAGGTDLLIVSFTGSGAFRWGKRLGGLLDDLAGGLAVDDAGRVYAALAFQGMLDVDGTVLMSEGGTDAAVIRLDASTGAHLPE